MTGLTRRTFLGSAAAAAALPRLAQAAPAVLEAGPVVKRLAPEGYGEAQLWGYDGGVPGPELRLRQGDRLSRRLVNSLSQPTSVHWHGIRIDNAMDGAAGLTQAPVAPGDSFDYDFALPDAGTYWYHAHMRSMEQVGRGLYGALIVEEPDGGPEVEADIVLALDDWRLAENGDLAGGWDDLHDKAHAGRYGNWPTTNGAAEWSRQVRKGDRLRLRVINTANARIMPLTLAGIEGWSVALDGMPLDSPDPVTGAITLAPAQRVDLIVDVTAEAGETAELRHGSGDGSFTLASFPIDGVGTSSRRPAPAPLPPNPRTAAPDLTAARRMTLAMEGGAMGGMDAATLNGKRVEMRQLVDAGMVWALNGKTGRPDDPMTEAARDEVLWIEMVNDTAFPHAMHLHGHHFREVAEDRLGPLRDTLLLDRRESREIVFAADNPGDWLLHCHMLGHQVAGMVTWLRVA